MSDPRTTGKKGRKPGQHKDTRHKMWLCYHLTMITKNGSPFKPQHKVDTKAGSGAFLEVAERWISAGLRTDAQPQTPLDVFDGEEKARSLSHNILALATTGRKLRETEAGDSDYYMWRNEREFIWWCHKRDSDSSSPRGGEFSPEHMEAVDRWYDEHPEVNRHFKSKSYEFDLTPVVPREIKTDHELTEDEIERIKSIQSKWASVGYKAALIEAKRRLGESDPWIKRDHEAWKLEGEYRRAGPVVWIPTPKSKEDAQDKERRDSGHPLIVGPRTKKVFEMSE